MQIRVSENIPGFYEPIIYEIIVIFRILSVHTLETRNEIYSFLAATSQYLLRRLSDVFKRLWNITKICKHRISLKNTLGL